MKKSVLTMAMLLALGSLAYAQDEPLPEAESREVAEVSVQVEEVAEEAPRKKQRITTCDSWNLEMGFTNWFQGNFSIPGGNGEPYALNNFQSLYVALNKNFRTDFPGPFAADFGVGVSAMAFAFEDATTQVINDADGLTFQGDNPIDGDPWHSQLGVSHFNVYCVPLLDLGGLKMGVGGYVGYRLLSANSLLYLQNDELKLDRTPGSYQMLPYRYGLRAQLGMRDVQVFANYDLSQTFNSGRAPALNAFNLGIIL